MYKRKTKLSPIHILPVAASGAASFIQNGNHTGVCFRADGTAKALFELDLHFRHDDIPNEVLQGGIVLLFMLMNSIRKRERQARDNEQRHAVAGEVHAFPRSAGCQKDGSGGALELPQYLRVVPAQRENGDSCCSQPLVDSG